MQDVIDDFPSQRSDGLEKVSARIREQFFEANLSDSENEEFHFMNEDFNEPTSITSDLLYHDHLRSTRNVGSVVEFSPATREARVRFPDVANFYD